MGCTESLYNRKRMHSPLGYKLPLQFPSDWMNTQQGEKLVG